MLCVLGEDMPIFCSVKLSMTSILNFMILFLHLPLRKRTCFSKVYHDAHTHVGSWGIFFFLQILFHPHLPPWRYISLKSGRRRTMVACQSRGDYDVRLCLQYFHRIFKQISKLLILCISWRKATWFVNVWQMCTERSRDLGNLAEMQKGQDIRLVQQKQYDR